MSLVELFCLVDDFCREFEPQWEQFMLKHNLRQRRRRARLSLSEVMTLVIHFHQSGYRNFKAFLLVACPASLESGVSQPGKYSRFVRLMHQAFVPLMLFVWSQRGQCTAISFADSATLQVCHNRRIQRHKVFAGLAARGKSSMGWFYGFKLHLVVNEHGEILAFQLTPGNVDDRQPVPVLFQDLFGKVFADKGYISKDLFEQLMPEVQLITGLRKNMKNILMPLTDKLLLRRRAIIETIHDQLKNISQIEHSRHRSITNFLVNLLAGLLAYCFQPKKPSLHLNTHALAALPC
jgi:hypothetical protein